MFSVARSIASRVPFAILKCAAPVILQRSPLVATLNTYRAFSNSSFLLASTSAKRPSATKTKPRAPASAKAKAKAKAKPRPKPKPKAKAKPKPASTYVPKALRPPRKPLSSFLLFCRRTTNFTPGADIKELVKNAAAAWSKLSDADKKPFSDEAKILYDNYVLERERWIKVPKNQEILKTLNKARKKRGKSLIRLTPEGHVRRPISSFLRFVDTVRKDQSFSPENAPVGNPKDYQVWVMREAGNKWRALPASEKDKFVKEYKRAWEDYKRTKA